MSRHKTVITSTKKQVSAVDGHKSKPNDFNVGAPSQDGASTKNVKNRDISLVREVKNKSKLTPVVKSRHKTVTTANKSKNKASGLGGGKFDLPSPLYSKSITINARNIDSSLYSNDQNHSTVSPALDSRHEIVTCSNGDVMDAAGSLASTKFDLSLVSRPQNKSRINNARNNDTFKLWDVQNQQKFGFIPLSDLALPTSDKRIPLQGSLLQARYDIAKEGKYNFMGAQVQIPSQLNPDIWQDYLVDYWDKKLPFLIRYGFPLDFDERIDLNHTEVNNPSANHHIPDINAYLVEEVRNKAVIGPFNESPYPDLHISPFMTRDEPGSKDRRVIIPYLPYSTTLVSRSVTRS